MSEYAMECSPYIARAFQRARNQDDAGQAKFDAIFDELHKHMEAGEAADKADEEMREAEMHHADMAYEERRVR